MRLLVAEDDESLRAVLERGLRENGYVVDAVADGEAAMAHLRAYEYDVAILDWRMPKASGIEVLEAIRKRDPEATRRAFGVAFDAWSARLLEAEPAAAAHAGK